jgi:hypothetical protein
MRLRLFPRFSALLALPLLASCASFSHPRDDPRDTQLVATDELQGSAGGPALADQAHDDSVRSDVQLAAANLVANDGQWYRTVHEDAPPLRTGWCGVGTVGGGDDPLNDGGVYRSFAPRVIDGSWIFVGLALGGEGIGPMVFGDVCDEAWTGNALGSRVRGMAPGVTMQDTSLLFTTRGRAVPTSGAIAGVVAGLAGFFAAQPARSDVPRMAKPREAPPATTSTPGQASPSAPARTPAAAPESARDDRRRSPTPSGGGGRPGGAREH